MDLAAATSHPVIRAAVDARAAAKSTVGQDPRLLTTTQRAAAIREWRAARDECDAELMRLLAASDDLAAESGARDVAAWLATETLTDRGTAGAEVRTATALATRWRAAESALAEGALSVEQARVICRGLDDLNTALAEQDGMTASAREDVLVRAEAELLRLATRHTPRELRRLAERILTVIAPEVGDEADRRALETAERRASAATSLHLRRRGDGSTDVHARIPDHVAERLRTYLDALTSPRVDALDHGVVDPATGQRLPGHRLAGEAFVALLERVDPQRLPLHGGAATTVVVTIDLDSLRDGLGEAVLGDGTRITAGEARRLACRANIVPAVLGGDSELLDLGRSRRLFTTAQRLALARRRATCQAQGCTVPSSWCEAHHVRPWSEGGGSDLDNAMLLCSWHHHRIHDRGYRHHRLPDGSVRFRRRT